ncbi:hypothetical protein [Hartmannibacter diazotrophicus]|nr:hypothetical protein [Hartmannibacter diazotrophicus]
MVVLLWALLAGFMLFVVIVALIYGTPERNPANAAIYDDSALPPTAPEEAGDTIAAVTVRDKSDPENGPYTQLKEEVAKLRDDLVSMRKSLDVMRQQNDDLVLRVDTLEKKNFDEYTGSINPIRRADPAPTPQSAPDTLQQRADEKAMQTRFGMELGTFDDLRSLRARWRQVVSEKPALFRGLDAVATVRDRGGRTELVLVAGPYRNAATAAENCGRVEAAGLACSPAFFLGQPLDLR